MPHHQTPSPQSESNCVQGFFPPMNVCQGPSFGGIVVLAWVKHERAVIHDWIFEFKDHKIESFELILHLLHHIPITLHVFDNLVAPSCSPAQS